jgi:predicted transcriptional regulator
LAWPIQGLASHLWTVNHIFLANASIILRYLLLDINYVILYLGINIKHKEILKCAKKLQVVSAYDVTINGMLRAINLIFVLDASQGGGRQKRLGGGRSKMMLTKVDTINVLKHYNLSKTDVAVYLFLNTMSNKANRCWPNYEMIMECTGINDRNTLARSIKKMSLAGVISVNKKRNNKGHTVSNEYEINKPITIPY